MVLSNAETKLREFLRYAMVRNGHRHGGASWERISHGTSRAESLESNCFLNHLTMEYEGGSLVIPVGISIAAHIRTREGLDLR